MLSLIRLACAVTLLGLCCAARAQPPAANEVLAKAQQARTMTEAMAILGIPKPEPGKKVLLEVPDIAVAGQAFTVKVQSRMPGTDWIAVFSERSAPLLVKLEEFPPGSDRAASAQINLAQTGRVRAIVRTGGKYYEVSREVKIATPGAAR
jgi:sulfur-oxidizing protein SoxY